MCNLKTLLISLLFFLFLSTYSIFAQDSLFSHQSARFEIGLGYGGAGEGGGVSVRLAISYIHHNWGGLIRLAAIDGARGKETTGFSLFYLPSGPKEYFYDEGILLSYIPVQGEHSQIIASAGIGFFSGKRLTYTKYETEDFGQVMGFAFELGVASAGSTFGSSLYIMGNINSITNLFAVVLSLTIGYQN